MERVIFDTNAYRYLANGREYDELDKYLEKVKFREQQQGIEALLSPIVAKELLAHVANKKDPSYEKCRKAIKAMYLHCKTDDEKYRMIASPELLISKSFFNKEIKSKVLTNQALGQMLFQFASDPSDHTINKLQRNLNLNYQHVVSTENEFASTMREHLRILDPKSDGWRIFENDEQGRKKALKGLRSKRASIEIAQGYILLVYFLLLGSGEIDQISKEVFDDMCEKFLDVFPEPIALFKVVIDNMINSEFNLFEDSRSNFVWDIHLMFNVGQHSIGGDSLNFVTSDKAMIRAAVKENPNCKIFTFDEYMEYLDLK